MSAVLFDVNVWLALAFSTHPRHTHAKDAFESASSEAPAVFCRATQQSFLRLVTTPTIQKCYGSELITNTLAWDRWETLAAMPQVLYLGEPPGLETHWATFAKLNTPAPKVWMDAYLAAFAKAYDIPITTLDTDFRNFKGLSVRILT
ncbi:MULTISPECIES: TA system VapC family ribonuclease toxin [unclassified Lentimonas]|uniref:TA system VapC family ribonuclease toxin n=1 Tax=unclassified Lentimonas TaxID=2630993 RepID=UPI0013277987|nr:MULTISPECIES: TA system VapC family ribonuclease toxin [unclassified Lentimonas]CAA6691148.1 Toxin 1, PIN domain [Lentimonas sp. CC10]CAA6693748.1 Toxin 1, PIN domain [Lentimonas sp. CC19]CAA7070118.1 Toxin 1, PIN domain [Lentimonas sp. CC11]